MEKVPLGEYGDLPIAWSEDDVDGMDYFIDMVDMPPISVSKAFPPPKPIQRTAFTPKGYGGEIRPFLELPASLHDTVIGRLALTAARKLEFPEVSAFLTFLSSASAAVSCAYATQYITRSPVPLGLYSIIEQPPATQKSHLLSIGIDAYSMAMDEHNKRINAKNREVIERDLPAENKLLRGFVLTTDATSAAMDRHLAQCSEGRFVIASAEQSALSSLFPESGSFVSNNELILKGYPGEYVSGMRGGREAYSGIVQGSITLVAQPGSSRRVIQASQGTGVAERFFFLSEPMMLGMRELTGEYVSNQEKADFEHALRKCVELYSDRVIAQFDVRPYDRVVMDPRALEKVRPTDAGFRRILERRRELEYRLGELAFYGENMAASWLGKYETHALKIAGVLHVVECLGNGAYPSEIIPEPLMLAAFDLIDLLAEHLTEIMHDAGESGQVAEEDTIIDLLSQKAWSKRELLMKAKNRKPFKQMGRDAYGAAARRVDAMIAGGELMVNARGRLEVV